MVLWKIEHRVGLSNQTEKVYLISQILYHNYVQTLIELIETEKFKIIVQKEKNEITTVTVNMLKEKHLTEEQILAKEIIKNIETSWENETIFKTTIKELHDIEKSTTNEILEMVIGKGN
jgi:DNA replicative helicase MCM subunit Mcm2 (Cdc46/Mcm family)